MNYGAETVYFFIGWVHTNQMSTIYQAGHKKYGVPFKTANDIIDVHLDLNKGTLGYVINGKDYGIAYDDVDMSKEYTLFLIVNGEGTSLEILSYDCQ